MLFISLVTIVGTHCSLLSLSRRLHIDILNVFCVVMSAKRKINDVRDPTKTDSKLRNIKSDGDPTNNTLGVSKQDTCGDIGSVGKLNDATPSCSEQSISTGPTESSSAASMFNDTPQTTNNESTLVNTVRHMDTQPDLTNESPRTRDNMQTIDQYYEDLVENPVEMPVLEHDDDTELDPEVLPVLTSANFREDLNGNIQKSICLAVQRAIAAVTKRIKAVHELTAETREDLDTVKVRMDQMSLDTDVNANKLEALVEQARRSKNLVFSGIPEGTK